MKFGIKEYPLYLYIIVYSFYILFNGKEKGENKVQLFILELSRAPITGTHIKQKCGLLF